eukprot:3702758-Lingulodinium_polyedra.AAC.1
MQEQQTVTTSINVSQCKTHEQNATQNTHDSQPLARASKRQRNTKAKGNKRCESSNNTHTHKRNGASP